MEEAMPCGSKRRQTELIFKKSADTIISVLLVTLDAFNYPYNITVGYMTRASSLISRIIIIFLLI